MQIGHYAVVENCVKQCLILHLKCRPQQQKEAAQIIASVTSEKQK